MFLEEETQALARQAGLEVIHPPCELRERLGSKIIMTRLANEAGVPSVPHTIGRVGSYDELLALAQSAGLGTTWSSRSRTATRAAGRSSSAVSATGTSTPLI